MSPCLSISSSGSSDWYLLVGGSCFARGWLVGFLLLLLAAAAAAAARAAFFLPVPASDAGCQLVYSWRQEWKLESTCWCALSRASSFMSFPWGLQSKKIVHYVTGVPGISSRGTPHCVICILKFERWSWHCTSRIRACACFSATASCPVFYPTMIATYQDSRRYQGFYSPPPDARCYRFYIDAMPFFFWVALWLYTFYIILPYFPLLISFQLERPRHSEPVGVTAVMVCESWVSTASLDAKQEGVYEPHCMQQRKPVSLGLILYSSWQVKTWILCIRIFQHLNACTSRPHHSFSVN